MTKKKTHIAALTAAAACILTIAPAGAQDIDAVERRLAAGVVDGELSLDQAKLMIDALKKSTSKESARGDMDARKRKYMAIARELEGAVKAGKLSKDDATKKLDGLRKEMFGGDDSRKKSSRDQEIDAKKRKYMELERTIRAAVEAGKLSKEDAQKKIASLRHKMFGGNDPEEGGLPDAELKKAEYKKVMEKIKGAVEAGELSKEDAEEKLHQIRKLLTK